MQTTESAANGVRRTHRASEGLFWHLCNRILPPMLILVAVAAVAIGDSQPVVKPLGPPQIQFRGVYVITAISTPFQLEVPASAPIYWRYPKGVKANYESGKPGKALIEVSELPAGDSTFEADCWQDGKLTVRKITVRNGIVRNPNPDKPDPPRPPPQDKIEIQVPKGGTKEDAANIAASFRYALTQSAANAAEYQGHFGDNIRATMGATAKYLRWADQVEKSWKRITDSGKAVKVAMDLEAKAYERAAK